MTKKELDERIDNMNCSIEEKIEYIESWMFSLDMIDRWEQSTHEVYRLLMDKLNELKKANTN